MCFERDIGICPVLILVTDSKAEKDLENENGVNISL